MGLIDDIENDRRQTMEKNRLEYFLLVAGIDMDEPSAADKKKLAKLVDVLNIPTKAIAQDKQAILTLVDKVKLAEQVEERKQATDDAWQNLLDVSAKVQEKTKQLNLEHRDAKVKHINANNQKTQAEAAKQSIGDADPIIIEAASILIQQESKTDAISIS